MILRLLKMDTNLLDKYEAMTAEQVREHKWTDEELDYLVAVKVMGWKEVDAGDFTSRHYGDGEGRMCLSWRPSRDMNDAMKVLEEALPVWWSIDRMENEKEIQVEGAYAADAYAVEARDKIISRAICIAALIAEKGKSCSV